MHIPIIYEDDDIIVIDKPAGLIVHPTNRKEKNTLVDFLINKCPEIKAVGDAPERPGIVHRLDENTSGLMVIAKNQETFGRLKEQFQNRKVEKKYLALVIGKLKDKKGIITKAIGRSRKKGIKQTIAPIVPRKEAITEYRVLKEYENYSMIEAAPKTGRMHQIRIHMASIGHPIAGDEKYKFKRQICPKELNRQFLHAYSLRFQMPDGIIKEFHSKLPDDLNKVLKNI